ncbi:MAG: hypothetical protein J0L57_05335 [Burkholderiales bacterium]|nr:hypothetical protein [Burkholderiales bacterium]
MTAPLPNRRGATHKIPRSALWLAGIAITSAVLVGGVYAGFQAYLAIGRTPGELLDYVDRRLLGHPKLEWLSSPLLGTVRWYFDAVPAAERASMVFLVPDPPPRRTAAEVAPAQPVPAGARVWRVGPRAELLRIADAAQLARSGDVVEIEAGDYRADVAVWNQERLTIRGVNGAARIHADGAIAEGKAIWVIQRGDFDISNIDFVGAKAEDRNGAGIRFEGGTLRVRHCLFWGNETGLLTSNGDHATNSSLIIEHSEFAYSSVPGHWAHNLYVGSIDSLSVVGSYFHHAGIGHLLKSRAKRSEVRYSRLTDEAGGRASYEMDFPNGGAVVLVGNVVQQGAGTENSVIVSYGAEGYTWPVNNLVMGSNTLVNDHPHGGTFLRVAPGASAVVSTNNLLVGHGDYQVRDALTRFNDQRAEWSDLAQPSRYDYRLHRPDDQLAYRAPSGLPGASALMPGQQYMHPIRLVPLAGPHSVVGADQREAP